MASMVKLGVFLVSKTKYFEIISRLFGLFTNLFKMNLNHLLILMLRKHCKSKLLSWILTLLLNKSRNASLLCMSWLFRGWNTTIVGVKSCIPLHLLITHGQLSTPATGMRNIFWEIEKYFLSLKVTSYKSNIQIQSKSFLNLFAGGKPSFSLY